MQRSRRAKPKTSRGSFVSYFKRNYDLYLLLVPGMVYLVIFKLLPLYGISLAFVDYNIFAGSSPIDAVFHSEFVGLDIFRDLFGREEFRSALVNTVVISFMKIFILFPLPIIVALMINAVGQRHFKRVLQTLVYMPHFLSWVIVGGIFLNLLSTTGLVNQLLTTLFGIDPIRFFMDNRYFRWVLIFTDGWKETGWGTIVYLAALMGVDVQLYEAATVDGASSWKQLIHITLPGIASTIVLMLIMRVGSVLDAGFTQILVMYNPTVYESADIIQTYTYRIGLGQMNFSMGTAVGLFNSVVAFLLVVTTNAISRKTLERSIW